MGGCGGKLTDEKRGNPSRWQWPGSKGTSRTLWSLQVQRRWENEGKPMNFL